MTSDEIRRTFLEFFATREHRIVPSASLVPSANDPSALFTVAGMHPLKPYFLGQETPPAPRLTSCQKVFRTPDIDQVGSTSRHLTFFEMLGNFSFGDYFKAGAIEFAWTLSLEVFGFTAQDIWITVFEGDEALGLGPDEEAIEAWRAVGVPRERIVECPRSENFWQAGPSGPCGPCSELYLDRGVALGSPDDLPGGENERFLEYWNLVFMQYDLGGSATEPTLTPLPARNIDTGLGLNRLACIKQRTDSVFETDQFKPLIELGEELCGRRYGDSHATDRSLRILADHLRGTSFLLADGVVPSNEERGYVLRRIMRRAIQQGRALELEPGFLLRYAERVQELMGGAYPELIEQREAIRTWLAAEEESFGRTLEQGTRLLEEVVARALESGAEVVSAEDAFRLHDTYGFPVELTRELAAESGLGVDGEGFSALMEGQRRKSRASLTFGPGDAGDPRARVRAFADAAGSPTTFTGYEVQEQATTVASVQHDGQRVLVKLAESPFYAAGGGQVSDAGWIECASGDCRAQVAEVFRLGDDQALAVALERGTLDPGERVVAHVDHAARRATECNHTATHLLHAALRERLGPHVRQAGSYVGPDKLRFDFSHSSALSPEELRDVEDRVNEWILAGDRVSAVETTLEEARRLGAMALFGEKYGDIVRMVQIGDGHYSRELCGGTHVRTTAEIGLLRIVQETSSAANVRRIEALTGPAAVHRMRHHDELLLAAAARLRTGPEDVPAVIEAHERERRELQRALAEGAAKDDGFDLEQLLAGVQDVGDGARVLAAAVPAADAKALMAIADRVKGALPDAAIVLGAAGEGRVHLVVAVAPRLVQRGVKAGAVVKAAAAVAGGGGGGRDTLAQAGGRDPEKLDEALDAGREAIVAALAAA
ncbi:MAG TPA: alanine--tRNA ligase [Solirubrobacteraceae bacterium]|nr:alanine--tRNA ligase [Solirubrobacteraceae bacterium]